MHSPYSTTHNSLFIMYIMIYNTKNIQKKRPMSHAQNECAASATYLSTHLILPFVLLFVVPASVALPFTLLSVVLLFALASSVVPLCLHSHCCWWCCHPLYCCTCCCLCWYLFCCRLCPLRCRLRWRPSCSICVGVCPATYRRC